MIHIYTGGGKGKTTASIGQMIRFIGYENKCIFSQFLKTEQSGEVVFFNNFCKDLVRVIRNDKKYPFSNKMSDEQKIEITKIHNNLFLEATKKFNSNEYGMLILDEIISTYNLELIDKKMVIEFLENIPNNKEVILTGRDCPKEFLTIADYISDINNIRNSFDFGTSARKGIEY